MHGELDTPSEVDLQSFLLVNEDIPLGSLHHLPHRVYELGPETQVHFS